MALMAEHQLPFITQRKMNTRNVDFYKKNTYLTLSNNFMNLISRENFVSLSLFLNSALYRWALFSLCR